MPLSAGDKLGSYEILAPIGAGGMGEVWPAKDTKLNLLASVRNDRRSAGKTTAVSAGLIVSTHEGHIVGGNPALEASGVNDVQLQGGYLLRRPQARERWRPACASEYSVPSALTEYPRDLFHWEGSSPRAISLPSVLLSFQ
jgi:hypothetical protein